MKLGKLLSVGEVVEDSAPESTTAVAPPVPDRVEQAVPDEPAPAPVVVPAGQ